MKKPTLREQLDRARHIRAGIAHYADCWETRAERWHRAWVRADKEVLRLEAAVRAEKKRARR